jgi:hypothetical protein
MSTKATIISQATLAVEAVETELTKLQALTVELDKATKAVSEAQRAKGVALTKGAEQTKLATAAIEVAEYAAKVAASKITTAQLDTLAAGRKAASAINTLQNLAASACRSRNLSTLEAMFGRDHRGAAHLVLPQVAEVIAISNFGYIVISGTDLSDIASCANLREHLTNLLLLADREDF